MPTCKGDPTADPKLVNEKCGLFVRGDPTDTDTGPGVGTLDKPFKTIQAAIDAVTDQWIFVCTKNEFAEKVTIAKENVAIYGGFDCSNGWVWKGTTKSTLKGPPDAIAWTVSSKGATVQNFKIQASTPTKLGGSSIAVLVDSADPSFLQCDMIAAPALPGTGGENAMPAIATAGVNGKNGGGACTKDTVLGAAAVANMCSPTDISLGGSGGDGTEFNGNSGAQGQPGTAGQGGLGESSVGGGCNGGQPGIGGAAGSKGTGATGDQNVGTLSASGFTPASGKDGTPGKPGQGGGGGGGAKGGAACAGKPGKGGASGGSGASGGCGGNPGKGGQGAGASIALVSLKSDTMRLVGVTLTAAAGVDGGVGGDAQSGGLEGKPGGLGGPSSGIFGLSPGCAGSSGGKGGDGGPGGGGRGGHSIGLAYTGTAPTIPMEVKFGTPGKGGKGGNLNALNNQGDDGKGAANLGF